MDFYLSSGERTLGQKVQPGGGQACGDQAARTQELRQGKRAGGKARSPLRGVWGCAVGKGASLPGLGRGGCGGPGRGALWGVLAHMGQLISKLFPPMGRVGALVAGPWAGRRSSSDLQSPRPGLGGRTSQVRLLELTKKNRPLCLRVTLGHS